MAFPLKGRREETVAVVMAEALPVAEPGGRALAVDDGTGRVEEALEARGLETLRWRRRLPVVAGEARDARGVSAWPEAGPPCGVATVRLPESWDAFAMMLHAAWGALRPGGRLLVYGANDEGARSAERRIVSSELFTDARTLETRRHCRVVSAWAVGNAEAASRASGPEPWREMVRARLAGGDEMEWVSYPGVFAHGRLDAGTALLLENLPVLKEEEGLRILDYGCGTGVIARRLLDISPQGAAASLDLLDRDAMALMAAHENVPEGVAVLGSGWAGAGGSRYDLVTSNPPLHAGKDLDFGLLREFIESARLRPGGTMLFVAQRAAPVEAMLTKCGFRYEIVAETRRYRVWRARPK